VAPWRRFTQDLVIARAVSYRKAKAIYDNNLYQMYLLRNSDMVQLVELLPDADVVVALEPDELGLRMLPVLATWPRFTNLSLNALLQHLIGNPQDPASVGQYPQNRRNEIAIAASEAWAWLENATLLVKPPLGPFQSGARELSRRHRQVKCALS
jgi:hypothetical protein